MPTVNPAWKSDQENRASRQSLANSKLTVEERLERYSNSYRSPMSSMDQQAEQDLRQNMLPIDVLRRYMGDGKASSNVVRLCLEAQRSRLRSTPRKQQYKILESLREEKLARMIMTHILQNFRSWTDFLHRERTAVDQLCYFCAIEGLEDDVLKWLEVPTPGKNQFWRARLFSGICTAWEMLDTRLSSDRTLETFFGVTDKIAFERKKLATERMRGRYREPSGIVHVNSYYAVINLRKHICDHRRLFGSCRTDEGLYDRFVEYFRDFQIKQLKADPQVVAWDTTRFQLYHPRTLDAGPALEVLASYAKNGTDAIASRETWDFAGLRLPVARWVRRTADVAKASGNEDAATWIFDTFQKELSTVDPVPLAVAQGEVRTLGVPLTPMQQRLLEAATQSYDSIRKARLRPAPKMLSPAEHADRLQALLS